MKLRSNASFSLDEYIYEKTRSNTSFSSIKQRYPVKLPAKYGKKDSSEENDFDECIENDNTDINEFIVKNRIEIMELCNNKNDKQLMKLIDEYSYDNGDPFCVASTFSDYCIRTIAIDCITNNNLQLFEIIVTHPNTYLNHCDVYIDVIRVISKSMNMIPFLHILIENNVEIHYNNISRAIGSNSVKFIDYLGSINYCLEKGWNEYIALLNFNDVDLLNIPMIKVLMNHKIQISHNLTDLINAAIWENSINIIEFLIESFSTVIEVNINQYLDKCCEANNDNALIYFLKMGANIYNISDDTLSGTKINIIRVLIDNNYPVPKNVFENLLIHHNLFDNDLNNVNYLLKYGALTQCIFDFEQNRANRQKALYGTIKNKIIYSRLEYVIMRGHFDKIKFLAENCMAQLKSDINRLFVIACANGQNHIVSYLYDLGAELNIKALICAIFFGHFQTVIMLLKYGMKFSLIYSINKNNLFDITLDGHKSHNVFSKIYYEIVNNDPIFRNDIYNYGNDNEYVKIVKLLIDHGVPTDNYCIFNRHSIIFYNVDIFTYFIKNGMDINIKWGSRKNNNFLTTAIGAKKLDVIEFLLQQKIDTTIVKNHENKFIIYENEQIKNLLLKYGVDLD